MSLELTAGRELNSRLADYDLIREAGRGGMSTVYEALDRRNGRRVALKVLASSPGLTPTQQNSLVTRLKREGRAITQLSHPHIVTVYEVGQYEGRHFLAMEYLEGLTLRDRLDAGTLSPPEAVEILAQIAGAVDAVHAAGFVHRDIKPSNVMLLPDGQVKLMDFGVARQEDDTAVTQAGSIVGSPAYMAPEQVRGEMGTPASDVWSLGVLIYEMLAGRPPFTGASIASVLYQVTHAPTPPVPGVSPPVQRVVRRALEKEPANRYPLAGALAEAFRTALAPPVPKARRPLALWAALPLAALVILIGIAHGRKAATSTPALSAPVAPTMTPPAPVRAMPRPPSPKAAVHPPRHKPAKTKARIKAKPIHHAAKQITLRRHFRAAHRRFSRHRRFRGHAGVYRQPSVENLERFIYNN